MVLAWAMLCFLNRCDNAFRFREGFDEIHRYILNDITTMNETRQKGKAANAPQQSTAGHSGTLPFAVLRA
jgi:hypothetical protein